MEKKISQAHSQNYWAISEARISAGLEVKYEEVLMLRIKNIR
ncbi:MAG: hypothetical protein WCG67_04930 [Ferruginibacter sp.]